MRLSIIPIFALATISGCATSPATPEAIATGWLRARGEPILFEREKDATTSPDQLIERVPCVSLVVSPTVKNLNGLAGKNVMVRGRKIYMSDLKIGPTSLDRLERMRYYKDIPVHNFCGNEQVFVVHSIEPIRSAD